MRFHGTVVLALVTVASGQLGGLGKGKGKSGKGGLGGLFGGSKSGGGMAGLAKSMGIDPNQDITSMVCQTFDGKSSSLGKTIGNMFGSPNGKGPDEKCMVDKSGGSGPYMAHYIDAPGLDKHTIYAPINPPSTPLPVIIWGNGFCMSSGKRSASPKATNSTRDHVCQLLERDCVSWVLHCCQWASDWQSTRRPNHLPRIDQIHGLA
jgi:hypothetical protein